MRQLRFLGIFIIVAAFLLLLAACESGEPTDSNGGAPLKRSGVGAGATTAAANSDPTETPTATPEQSALPSLGRLSDLAPADILALLPKGPDTETIIYLNVQEAIESLDGHGAVRDQLKEEVWDYYELGDALNIDIADLDYLAFGEVGSPDADLFVVSGVDTGDLRERLDDLGFAEMEIQGEEVWLEVSGTDNPTDWESFAFLGESVLIVEHPFDMMDVLARMAGAYDVLADLHREILAGQAAAQQEVVSRLRGDADLIATWLSMMRETGDPDLWDVRDLFEDATEEEHFDWNDQVENLNRFASWIAGNREGLQAFWEEVTEYESELEEVLREVEFRKGSLTAHDAADLWAALPEGIVKEMLAHGCQHPYYAPWYDCTLFGQSVNVESDSSFRLTGRTDFATTEEALEAFLDTEPDDIHEACSAAFQQDGPTITFEAVCDIEALIDLVVIS